MAKIGTIFFSLCLVLLLALPAEAGLLSLSQSQLMGMSKAWDGDYMDGTTSSEVTVQLIDPAVRFSASMQLGLDGRWLCVAASGGTAGFNRLRRIHTDVPEHQQQLLVGQSVY